MYYTYVHLAALCARLLRQSVNDDLISPSHSRFSFLEKRAIFTHKVNAEAKFSPLPSCASQAGTAEWKGRPEGEESCTLIRSRDFRRRAKEELVRGTHADSARVHYDGIMLIPHNLGT